MRLGKNERAILARCEIGVWTPPSRYLPVLFGCPSRSYSLNRLVYDKGLLQFRFEALAKSLSHAELLEEYGKRAPGRETSEHMAAVMLTPVGEVIAAPLIAAFAIEEAKREAEHKAWLADFLARQADDLDGEIPF